MDGWIQELWLTALCEELSDGEVGRWWNSHETDFLDALVLAAPAVRRGQLAEFLDGHEGARLAQHPRANAVPVSFAAG